MEISKEKAKVKKIVAFTICFLLLSFSFFLELNIEKKWSSGGISSKKMPEQIGQVFWSYLGGAKSIVIAYLWLKIDRIHHEYYGDLGKERELIPLYRLVTWIDPHFVDAYYVGSYMLQLFQRPKEALEFAEEGVAFNPKSSKLLLNLGQLYFIQKNYSTSIKYLEKAKALSKDEAEKFIILSTLKIAYLKEGQFEKAERVMKIIKKMEKEN